MVPDSALGASHHVRTLLPPVKGLGSDSASLWGLLFLPTTQQLNQEVGLSCDRRLHSLDNGIAATLETRVLRGKRRHAL